MNEEGTLQGSLDKFNFSSRQRIALLFGNYIPILHVLIIVGTLVAPWAGVGWRVCLALGFLYLLPPVLARCILALWPIREGHIAVPSRDYFVWWGVLNLQIIFCRLTFLEEAMRLVPGLYTAWLRLWGSRIGSFTYWAAGLRILDRSFLDIGDGVAFGAGVRLNPHVIAENESGQMELILAKIHIGHRAIVGGYGLLTAGTRVDDGENTRACLTSPPFSHWKAGKRVPKAATTSQPNEN
jgi:hypothetical protein